ncbi:MAG: mechanosensitive ion channel domain-containing protein [Pseudomonadota bacterium]
MFAPDQTTDQSDTPPETGSPNPAAPEAPSDAAAPIIDQAADNKSVLAGEAGKVLDEAMVREKAFALLNWLKENLLTIDVLVQAGILVGALVPAAIFGPRLKALILDHLVPLVPTTLLKRAARALAEIATPIALFLTLQIASAILGASGISTALIGAAISLLSAWIVIRLVTLVIRSPFWSKVAFYVAWPIAALDAFGYLGKFAQELERISFPIGENDSGEAIRFSALDGMRILIVFAVLFWIANLLKGFLADRIRAVDELTPSIKALLIKIIDILTPVIALLMALQLVGFNLATLTIFGGAIGLGVGLGLQKTIANFIAGFTLVADKSIKPSDVIEVGDTFGWVTAMGARYVTVRTRDGTEHLVPNDRFIEDGVINWSHADRVVRLHAPFGVSYSTKDMRGIAKMAEELVVTIPRVLKTPAPRCNLMEFGDSSVNFDLRFWINDPANGQANVRSDVLMAIWDKLADMGVEIPFPQRDLHIKSAPGGVLEAVVTSQKTANGTDHGGAVET